jgi:hypothetical protein
MMSKTALGFASILLTAAANGTAIGDEISPKACTVVADTIDGAVVKTRALLQQAEELHLSGLTNRLSKEDQAAYQAAYEARLELLKAGRQFQAAYEDMAYRMRVCSRR